MPPLTEIKPAHTGQDASSGTRQEIDPTLLWLASVMDDAYTIPGTNVKMGFDALIGLIPGVGDLATVLVGSMFLREAKRLGVSRWTLTRMYANYGVDLLVGMVPILGDMFDVAFKAHRRNLRLLQNHLKRKQGSMSDNQSRRE